MRMFYAETISARKACVTARYLGSPVEYVPVNLGKGEHKTPSFLAINPNGKVPVLQDGDRTIWESGAIMCYLAQRAHSDFWPRDERQIEVLRWLLWDVNHFGRHAGRLYFEHIVRPLLFNGAGPVAAEVEDALKYFHVFAPVLDKHLSNRHRVVGEDWTAADFALANTLASADAARIPVKDYPNISRWYGELEQLEAWRAPFPS